jgi:hypothetical protein
MKLSKVFAAAKKFLVLPEEVGTIPSWGEKKRYICYAIDCTDYCERSRRAATKVIEDRLGEHAFLEGWLEARLGRKFTNQWEVAELPFRQKMQATRHAWIDSLIAEFKAKGN